MQDWAAVTIRMIADLRTRGIETHDLRGTLGEYDGTNRGKVVGVHWTGDNFGRIIPATNSLAEDKKLVEFYRWYHMEGGHGWPGIAYAILAFPSGRVFVSHNLDRLTYHAFNANDDGPAVSCPVSNRAEPTSQQLYSLTHILDWLCFDCAELAAGQRDVWGHKELAFLDARNAGTECPGTLLPHIATYRARGKRQHALDGVNLGRNEGRELKAWAESLVPFAARGSLLREGVTNLTEFPGGKREEWVAKYERVVAHRLGGTNQIMTLDLYDRLRTEGKIIFY